MELSDGSLFGGDHPGITSFPGLATPASGGDDDGNAQVMEDIRRWVYRSGNPAPRLRRSDLQPTQGRGH